MDRLVNYLMNVDEKKIIYRASFWNMIASVLNSITSAVLLFFITRFCGLNAAGIFSIASAIGYQCLSLGNFGARSFHAADVKKDYSFSDYLYIRVFSYSLLLIMLCYYAFCSGYTLDKSLAVLSFGLFKSVDVIEDLYHGEYHRNNRLDIGAFLLTLRYFLSILVFIILICITRDITISSILTFVITLVFFIITNKDFIKIFSSEKLCFRRTKFISLLIILVPIVITNYIKLYITNAPKYAIDSCLGNVEQAYFNVLFMPVFIISLLSDIIFRPFIPRFSREWINQDYDKFLKMMGRQLAIIIGITFVIMTGGYLLGLTLLEMIYGVQLHEYMGTFMLLLAGGGINTYCSFMILVMTIQREQNKMAVVNILSFILCLLISNPLVKTFGLNGAMMIFVALNLFPAILFTVIVVRKMIQVKNNRE